MQTASFPVNGVVGDALVNVAFEAAIVVDDVSWRVVAATPAVEGLYGAAPIGVAVEALFKLDGEQEVRAVIERAEAEPVETSLERADGEARTVVLRTRRLALEGCTAFVVAILDVTREREAVAELARVREFHRTLLDALGIGVFIIDPSGLLEDHNHFEPVERAFGVDLRGRNFFLEIATGPEARLVFQRLQHWAHRADRNPYQQIFEFEASGRLLEAELHAGARVGDHLVHVRVSDATERIRAERELRHKTYEAEEAARRTRLVYQTSSLIHRSLDLKEVFETAVAETGRLLGASRCQIVLQDAAGRLIIAHEYRRASMHPVEMLDDGLDANPLVASALRTLNPMVVESSEHHPLTDLRGLLAASGARATLVAPIAVQRDARGALAIHDCEHPRLWSDGDIELAVSIASQVGLAIGHVEIHEQVRRQAERARQAGAMAAEIHATATLEEAMQTAASMLAEELDAVSVSITLEPSESGPAIELSRVDRSSIMSGDPAVHAVHSPIVARDGAPGKLTVEMLARPDVETQGLIDTIAVHLGLAAGAASLLEAVTSAKAVWEGTFDAMTDGIVVHDEEFSVVRANNAFARLMKSKAVSLVGTCMLDLFAAEAAEAIGAACERVTNTRRHADIEVFEPSLGKHLRISISRQAGSEVPAFIHTVRDVTEEREITERLAQSSKLASIGHLAAGVAHEINTPLATIAGSAQSLSRQLASVPELVESPKWAAVMDRLDAIVEQSFRCKRITHELLNFAAPTRPSMEPIDLMALARDAIETAERGRGESRVRLVSRGALAPVPTDAELVRQVLINLVTNAIDAIDERGSGKVIVEVQIQVRVAKIAVRDTGTGISDEDIERIFDPFFTTKPSGKGTGLGLSISQNIVSNLGGTLKAESKSGRGSTFTIKLPVSKPKVSE